MRIGISLLPNGMFSRVPSSGAFVRQDTLALAGFDVDVCRSPGDAGADVVARRRRRTTGLSAFFAGPGFARSVTAESRAAAMLSERTPSGALRVAARVRRLGVSAAPVSSGGIARVARAIDFPFLPRARATGPDRAEIAGNCRWSPTARS